MLISPKNNNVLSNPGDKNREDLNQLQTCNMALKYHQMHLKIYV